MEETELEERERDARRRAGRWGVGVGVGIAGAVVAATAWYGVGMYRMNRTGPDIEFVLPEEYRGQFTLVVDPKRGQKLVEEDGKVVVRITDRRVAEIHDDRYFTVWHKHAGRHENGTRIRAEGDDGVGPEDVAVRFVKGNNERMVYVVGTAKEAWAAHEDW